VTAERSIRICDFCVSLDKRVKFVWTPVAKNDPSGEPVTNPGITLAQKGQRKTTYALIMLFGKLDIGEVTPVNTAEVGESEFETSSH